MITGPDLEVPEWFLRKWGESPGSLHTKGMGQEPDLEAPEKVSAEIGGNTRMPTCLYVRAIPPISAETFGYFQGSFSYHDVDVPLAMARLALKSGQHIGRSEFNNTCTAAYNLRAIGQRHGYYSHAAPA